jgi:hypothetical protein
MAQRLQVSFDAADPPRLAKFWVEALGYVEEPPPPGFDTWEAFAASHGLGPESVEQYAALIDPDSKGPRLFFQRVPEDKRAKNRVHLDVSAPEAEGTPDRRAAVDAFAERLIRLGATRVADHDQFGQHWVVLQDPEGNEFCVV